MKTLIALTGAAAMAIAGPAFAKPGQGGDHDRNHADSQGWNHDGDHDWNRGDNHGYRNNNRACPPGLAKKHNGCMPPGQAKRYNRGQHWRDTYGRSYSYNRIPYDLRQRYDLNNRYRYYYNNGYLYAVDPRTQLIQQVISALLR